MYTTAYIFEQNHEIYFLQKVAKTHMNRNKYLKKHTLLVFKSDLPLTMGC